MSYFKDLENKIHFLEDDAYAHLLPIGSAIVSEAEALEIQAASTIEASYEELRRVEYPSFIEYIDGVVKGDQAQIQAYIDACLAVKAKYPKGA